MRLRVAAPIALACAWLVGCGGLDAQEALGPQVARGAAGHFVVTATSDPETPTRGTNALLARITDSSGAIVIGATVTARTFMPAHGHGSSVKPAVSELGGGDYRVDDLVFTMQGRWDVTLSVASGELSDDVVISLDVP